MILIELDTGYNFDRSAKSCFYFSRRIGFKAAWPIKELTIIFQTASWESYSYKTYRSLHSNTLTTVRWLTNIDKTVKKTKMITNLPKNRYKEYISINVWRLFPRL